MSIDRWHTLTVFPWLETVLKNRTRYVPMAAFFLDALRYPLCAHAQASPLGNYSAELEPTAVGRTIKCSSNRSQTRMPVFGAEDRNGQCRACRASKKGRSIELSEGNDTLARTSRGALRAQTVHGPSPRSAGINGLSATAFGRVEYAIAFSL
jgi:hypothetical protein